MEQRLNSTSSLGHVIVFSAGMPGPAAISSLAALALALASAAPPLSSATCTAAVRFLHYQLPSLGTCTP